MFSFCKSFNPCLFREHRFSKWCWCLGAEPEHFIYGWSLYPGTCSIVFHLPSLPQLLPKAVLPWLFLRDAASTCPQWFWITGRGSKQEKNQEPILKFFIEEQASLLLPLAERTPSLTSSRAIFSLQLVCMLQRIFSTSSHPSILFY